MHIYTISRDGENLQKITDRSDSVAWAPIDWTPDGKSITYFSTDNAIRSIPADGGESRFITEVDSTNSQFELAWSPDGRELAYTDKGKIWIYNPASGTTEEVKTGIAEHATKLGWSPDGQKIAFTAYGGGDAELWMMEDFLPLEKLDQKKEARDLLIRKVLSDAPSEPLGTISPDGRYISFVDWGAGSNISIFDLETKDKQVLTSFNEPYEQGYYSSWSPDGKNIAYFWWDSIGYNLSIVDLKQSKSRDLLKSDKVDWIELGNWSWDGKYIVATLSLKGKPESQLVRISTVDGSVYILKAFDKSHLGGKPYFSPDSRYVAYDLPDDAASGNTDIYIYSIEDKRENALFKYPAMDYILGWTPDGRNILFATDRKGTVDIMMIGFKDGRSFDQPKLIKSNIGLIVPMGFTRNGVFYYGQWPYENNIYTAEIDLEKFKVLTEPSLAIRRFEGKNRAPSYSNDGKYLAYISDRGFYRKGNNGNVLCIQDLRTGEVSEIMPDPEMTKPIRSFLRWSPDNHSIAFACWGKENHSRIYIYDIQAKKFKPVGTGSGDLSPDFNCIYPLWSKDGKSLYYLQYNNNSKSSSFIALNIATGKESELYKYSSDDYYDRCFTLSLSPDGQWLSAINVSGNKFVRLISTIDGKTRDLYSCKTIGPTEYDQIWTTDGKYIIITYPKYLDSGGHEWNLMRLPFEGGENLSIRTNMLGIFNPTIHPDGRTLSFESTGYSKPENSIWAMENFVPK
jgi:Tol biopolymer transport system component